MSIDHLPPEIQARLRNLVPRLETFVNSLTFGSCVREAFNQAGIYFAEGEIKNGMTIEELRELSVRYRWVWIDSPSVISTNSRAIVVYKVSPEEGHAVFKDRGVSAEGFVGKELLGSILLND